MRPSSWALRTFAERKLSKPELGHLNKAGVPQEVPAEFDLDNASELNVGDIIKADTFKPATSLTSPAPARVTATPALSSAGTPAAAMTHGGGPVHRHAGSMGSTTDPSRIFKGKIGPGQMGGDSHHPEP